MENVKANGNKQGAPDEIPDFEQQIQELQNSVAALREEKANLRDQMLQANLYELAQRRENDSLREELSQLRRSVRATLSDD